MDMSYGYCDEGCKENLDKNWNFNRLSPNNFNRDIYNEKKTVKRKIAI